MVRFASLTSTLLFGASENIVTILSSISPVRGYFPHAAANRAIRVGIRQMGGNDPALLAVIKDVFAVVQRFTEDHASNMGEGKVPDDTVEVQNGGRRAFVKASDVAHPPFLFEVLAGETLRIHARVVQTAAANETSLGARLHEWDLAGRRSGAGA
jgi:hypothetical protein